MTYHYFKEMKITSYPKIELYRTDYINVKDIPAYSLITPYAQKEDIKVLEEILNKEDKTHDLTESFFSGKSNILMIKILDLVSQIRERKRMQELNVRRRNKDVLSLETGLLQLDSLRKSFAPYTPDMGKRKTALESKIIDLESEKGKEYVECFRDLVPLKESLLDSLRAYRTASFRRDIFQDGT